MSRGPDTSSRTLVTYQVAPDESVTEAVSAAFGHVEVDVYAQETVLEDWINTDGLDALRWESSEELRVSTVIWGHPTVLTADEVRIYDADETE